MAGKKTLTKEHTMAKGKREEGKIVSYRLKCEKTANGLSHFVMYGDVPKEKNLL